MYCTKCGQQLGGNGRFCPSCGSPVGGDGQNNTNSARDDFNEQFKKMNDTNDTTNQFSPDDINQNKSISILSYISILFIVPLIGSNNSPFARYHVNQGLILFIIEIAWNIAISILSNIFWFIGLGWMFKALAAFGWLGFIALSIVGIVNAANGRAKELPIIGKYTIIK